MHSSYECDASTFDYWYPRLLWIGVTHHTRLQHIVCLSWLDDSTVALCVCMSITFPGSCYPHTEHPSHSSCVSLSPLTCRIPKLYRNPGKSLGKFMETDRRICAMLQSPTLWRMCVPYFHGRSFWSAADALQWVRWIMHIIPVSFCRIQLSCLAAFAQEYQSEVLQYDDKPS